MTIESLLSRPVSTLLPRRPAPKPPHRDLRSALDVMVEMGVRRLPAVNSKGRVIGILSLDDILIELAGQLGKVQELLQVERGAQNPDDQIPD
jgi:predicted transcriptional regulator